MPDLYPKNIGFTQQTYHELSDGARKRFGDWLAKKNLDQADLASRFRVFCFKHDLEALILAAVGPLRTRLDLPEPIPTWIMPVEDQDHERPPKHVVEELYQAAGKRYVETVEAPQILRQESYQDIAERCPQCFKPFVEFLQSLA